MKNALNSGFLFFYGICCVFLGNVYGQNNDSLTYKDQNYSVRALDINTEYNDYGVDLYKDSLFIFSSPSKEVEIKKYPYIELHQAQLTEEGNLVKPNKFLLELNSNLHEASFAFTKNGQHVYFTSGDQSRGEGLRGSRYVQLYVADVVDNTLQNITLLDFNEPISSTGYPFLAEDDKVLYFTSDRYGGNGGMDLYKVSVLGRNSFGDLINLGERINTSDDEMYSFIDSNNILYFSSNRKGTTGGLDVYATPLENTSEGVYKLPSPINSKEDDFDFMLYNSSHGFMSSNREGGMGEDDIYAVTLNNLQEIKGITQNKRTGELLADIGVSVYLDGKLIDSTKTNGKGEFKISKILPEKEYKIRFLGDNFMPDSVSVSTPSDIYYSNKVDFNLTEKFKKNEVGETIINSDPIYFDLGKWDVTEEGALVLDNIVKIMSGSPKMVIEVDSHTDSKGSKEDNLKLSITRAKSIVDYIVSKGISADRISYKGYGESNPVNKCVDGVKCTEEEHQLNRRTEFVLK